MQKLSVKESKPQFRVARSYNFKPKITIWVNFGGPYNGKGRFILYSFGL
jgi:hypothetical protein